MEKKLKVGIVGCGGIANGKHLPSLAKIPEVEMVAFCDIIVERAEAAKAKYGTEDAKVYEDYRELLADKSIDVVHVLTPNNMHAPITIDALEAGKHVMCEKPMAKTAAEAQEMLEAAKRTGKKLTIGYQNRQRKEMRHLKQLCADGVRTSTSCAPGSLSYRVYWPAQRLQSRHSKHPTYPTAAGRTRYCRP